MDNKNEMKPDEVAKSEERQFISLKKAQDDKMKELIDQRNYIVELKRTIQGLIYAAGYTYKAVYPGAEGFVEGRIKSIDSIATKTRNEFTEMLSEIRENPDIDQKPILDKIAKIDFKDILAFSVITSVPPKKFRTGSDEVNSKLTSLVEELELTSNRLKEHKAFVEANKQRMLKLSSEISEAKAKLNNAMSREDKEKLIRDNIVKGDKSKEIIDILATPDKETILGNLEYIGKLFNLAKANVEYGESNDLRTKEVYERTLRDLQYEMSEYFVSNLSRFSVFKFWGAQAIREPKVIKKPGFRAVNTGYDVAFSNNKNKAKIKFEAQGKGELDYNDGEFTALGAGYHEEQKTKDGLISKKTEMPDFTIIGAEQTARIERDARRKYEDLTSIEDLAENLGDENIDNEHKELKRYEEKIKSEINEQYGDNSFSKKELKGKLNIMFNAAKEHLIQEEIEKRINEQIEIFANSDVVKNGIKNSEELTGVYEKEKQKLEQLGTGKRKSEQEARIKVLYYMKEKEISEYAKTSIPMFFRANLSGNADEEIMVYWLSTGESIYRYFINKLNGLKEENRKVQI